MLASTAGTAITKFGFAALIAGAGTAGVIALAAPATAAPSGTGSAQDTITSLEAEGYDVVVNRLSETPLEQADVLSVGRGQSSTQPAGNHTGRDGATLYGPVALMTVYVNVR